jgi:hypothetical protein
MASADTASQRSSEVPILAYMLCQAKLVKERSHATKETGFHQKMEAGEKSSV